MILPNISRPFSGGGLSTGRHPSEGGGQGGGRRVSSDTTCNYSLGAMSTLRARSFRGVCRPRQIPEGSCPALFCFFPQIRDVGFSLDSTPGLRSTLCHFAVSPPRFWPRPRGSIHIAVKSPTVPSNRGSALIWGSRFSVPAALGPRRAPKSPTPRPVYLANLGRFARLHAGFVAPTGSPRTLGISGYWTPSI